MATTIDELIEERADELAKLPPAGPTTIQLDHPITHEVPGEVRKIESLTFDWLRWRHVVDMPLDSSIGTMRELAVIAARQCGLAVVSRGQASAGPLGMLEITDWRKVVEHVGRAIVPLKLATNVEVEALDKDQTVYLERADEISASFPKELKIRRLRAGDVFGIKIDPRLTTMGDMLTVCASATDQPTELLGKMLMADVGKCWRVLLGFFAQLQPETSEGPSGLSPSE